MGSPGENILRVTFTFLLRIQGVHKNSKAISMLQCAYFITLLLFCVIHYATYIQHAIYITLLFNS